MLHTPARARHARSGAARGNSGGQRYDGRVLGGGVEELWANVLAHWNDERAHTAFLEHCRVTRQLDVAARRYRHEAQPGGPYRADPSHVEIARKKLQGVTALAVLELEGSRRVSEGQSERIRLRRSLFRWSLLVFVVLGLVVATMHARR